MKTEKRVLVLGATGMLGHMVRRVLAALSSIGVEGTHVCEERDPFYFDVMSGLGKLEVICDRASRYDYFINCIGILPAGLSGNDPDAVRKAIKINSLFPHALSALARARGTRVIHISTDGVFSGQAEIYDEDARHDCLDFYGITKSLGEVTEDHFLNLRCSIIGPSPFLGEGLMEWFLRQPDHSTVPGYTNHIWHGISTYQFANLCLKIIRDDHFEELRRESAVFHFAPNEPIAKYKLLCLFQSIYEKKVNVQPVASDDKIYRRILRTRFRGLQQIYPYDISAADMVSELAAYMKNNRSEYHEGNVG